MCVDTKVDPANCDGCGKACAAGEVCSGGTCGLSCTGGTMICGGSCVDPKNDPANCSGCGKACGSDNASALCSGGSCGLVCHTGFDDCNGMNADGCEANLGSDTGNCGKCGNACSTASACSGGSCVAPLSCAAIHATFPAYASGVYTIDADGDGPMAPFPVYCDMTTAGGGWTLVARELPSTTGTLQYLDRDTANDAALAAGTASGIIGHRFAGKYTDFWIAWDGGQYIRGTFSPAFDIFSNTVNVSIPLSGYDSSDATLDGWVTSAGGAKFCVASHDSDIRPGDTSWAVKAVSDDNTECGCNSGAWVGQGAYYGGEPTSQTVCSGWGGGWAGVVGSGVQKGGITPSYETDLYIR